jgi:hypothetical protein
MQSLFSVEYNKFKGEDIKKIELKSEENNEERQFLYIDDKSIIINFPSLIFRRKIGANLYLFQHVKTVQEFKQINGLFKHVIDSISKKLSMKSKDIWGKTVSKKSIKDMFNKPMDEKGQMKFYMTNNKSKKELSTSIRKEIIATKEMEVNMTQEDVIRDKDKNIKDKIEVYKRDDGSYYKLEKQNIIKEEIISGISTLNFNEKFPAGSRFIPKILFDYVLIKDKIDLILVPYELKIDVTAKKTAKKYEYSDSEEDSDQDYYDDETKKNEEKQKKVKPEELEKLKTKEIKDKNDESDDDTLENKKFY